MVTLALMTPKEGGAFFPAVGKMIQGVAKHGLTKAIVAGTSYGATEAAFDTIQTPATVHDNRDLALSLKAEIERSQAYVIQIEKIKADAAGHSYIVIGFGSTAVGIGIISLLCLIRFYLYHKIQNEKNTSDVEMSNV